VGRLGLRGRRRTRAMRVSVGYLAA
jgi:hypothetical protein